MATRHQGGVSTGIIGTSTSISGWSLQARVSAWWWLAKSTPRVVAGLVPMVTVWVWGPTAL